MVYVKEWELMGHVQDHMIVKLVSIVIQEFVETLRALVLNALINLNAEE